MAEKVFEVVADLGFSCFDGREGGRDVQRSMGWMWVLRRGVVGRLTSGLPGSRGWWGDGCSEGLRRRCLFGRDLGQSGVVIGVRELWSGGGPHAMSVWWGNG